MHLGYSVLIFLTFIAKAQAKTSNYYIGAGAASSIYAQTGLNDSKFSEYRVIAGIDVSKYFALETHIATSEKGRIDVSGTSVDFTVNNLAAGFLRLQVPIHAKSWGLSTVNLGLLAGKVRMQTLLDDGFNAAQTSMAYSTAYGASIDLFAGVKWSLRFDHLRYVDNKSTSGVPYSYTSVGLLLMMRLDK